MLLPIEINMRLSIIFLLVFLLAACSDGEPSIPDRLPDAGPEAPSQKQIDDCCGCLSENSAALDDGEAACFDGSIDECVSSIRYENGLVAPEDCFTSLCKSECDFLLIE